MRSLVSEGSIGLLLTQKQSSNLPIVQLLLHLEDKGDSPGGIDSDSSSSSPAPPSSHNQRTASSVAISGTHYQTTAGLIKGIKHLHYLEFSRFFFFERLNVSNMIRGK